VFRFLIVERAPRTLTFNVDLCLFPTERCTYFLPPDSAQATEDSINVCVQQIQPGLVLFTWVLLAEDGLLITLAHRLQILRMLIQLRSVLRADFSGTPLVSPATNAPDSMHQRRVGFPTVHDILHVGVNVPW
jgi:hypothetical protein